MTSVGEGSKAFIRFRAVGFQVSFGSGISILGLKPLVFGVLVSLLPNIVMALHDDGPSQVNSGCSLRNLSHIARIMRPA